MDFSFEGATIALPPTEGNSLVQISAHIYERAMHSSGNGHSRSNPLPSLA